jgi:hypothetical protein
MYNVLDNLICTYAWMHSGPDKNLLRAQNTQVFKEHPHRLGSSSSSRWTASARGCLL